MQPGPRERKREGLEQERVNAEDVELVSPEPQHFLIAMDAALDEFAKAALLQAKVIELRYFGGRDEKEIAEVLRVSTANALLRVCFTAAMGVGLLCENAAPQQSLDQRH
jgi:hypothetical protein